MSFFSQETSVKMNFVLVVLFFGAAVVYGQSSTNAGVRSCMQQAQSNCLNQCVGNITDVNLRQRVSSCYQQVQAQKAQRSALVKACVDPLVGGNFDDMPCSRKSSKAVGSWSASYESKSNSQLLPFHKCNRSCIKTQKTICTAGCTSEPTSNVRTALKQCRNPVQPPTAGIAPPTFNMGVCMQTALAGTI